MVSCQSHVQPTAPPPLTQLPQAKISQRSKFLIALALVAAFCVNAIIMLRICGLVRPFSVPTGAMTPAVSAGGHIMMEGVTYLFRHPRRGDIVVFKTDGIASLPAGQFYVKRVAGEPGDHVRISGGRLFVNDKQVSLSNDVGEIAYNLPRSVTLPQTDVTVPIGCYFVLGDNSTNSFDSRFWGSVPRENVIGRVSVCYWPPEKAGGAK